MSLLGIPYELQLAIFSLLPPAEAHALRFVCRRVLPAATTAFVASARTMLVEEKAPARFAREMLRAQLLEGSPMDAAGVGGLLRAVGVPGESCVVAQLGRHLRLSLAGLAQVFTSLQLSRAELRCQLDAGVSLGRTLDSKGPHHAVRFLELAGVPRAEQRDLILELESLSTRQRWRMVAELEDWRSRFEARDFACGLGYMR
ncbi:hypothetical protein DFJ74DRAFT_713529 [Hyaloraphidium curvatum]|nr:hypothetical protein DFJ74DRAFT_713529 [Hyaloraphidium curvatum]